MTGGGNHEVHDNRGDAWPAARAHPVAELDRMPDDGRRYELLDGVLVLVGPSPRTRSRWVSLTSGMICVILRACQERPWAW